MRDAPRTTVLKQWNTKPILLFVSVVALFFIGLLRHKEGA